MRKWLHILFAGATIAIAGEAGGAAAETTDPAKLKETIADVTALSLLCMEWSVNGEKVGALYTAAGFDIATSHEIYLISKDKMAEYKKVQADAAASCIDLQAKYGPNGTIMPA